MSSEPGGGCKTYKSPVTSHTFNTIDTSHTFNTIDTSNTSKTFDTSNTFNTSNPTIHQLQEIGWSLYQEITGGQGSKSRTLKQTKLQAGGTFSTRKITATGVNEQGILQNYSKTIVTLVTKVTIVSAKLR